MSMSSALMSADISERESAVTDHEHFDPRKIFNVEGMVVVITGGGTGAIIPRRGIFFLC